MSEVSQTAPQAAHTPFPEMTPAELAEFWEAVQLLRTERAQWERERGTQEKPGPLAEVIPGSRS